MLQQLGDTLSATQQLLRTQGLRLTAGGILADVAAGVGHCLSSPQACTCATCASELCRRPESAMPRQNTCVMLHAVHPVRAARPGTAGASMFSLTLPGGDKGDGTAQVPNTRALDLLVELLECWAGAEAEVGVSAALQLERLLPLRHMMQLAGHALSSAPPAEDPGCGSHPQHAAERAAALQRIHGFADVLQRGASRGRALQRAAALTAIAGLLEGLQAPTPSPGAAAGEVGAVADGIAAWLPAACGAAAAAAPAGSVPPPDIAAAMQRDAAAVASLLASQVAAPPANQG